MSLPSSRGSASTSGVPRNGSRSVRETVEIVRGAWAGEPFSYGGAVHRVAGANVRPGPVQQPQVPLLIAVVASRSPCASSLAMLTHPTSANTPTRAAPRRLTTSSASCGCWIPTAAARVDRPNLVLRTHLAIPFVLAQTATALDAKLDALPERWRSIVLPLRGKAVGLLGTPEEAVAYFRDRRAAGLQYFVARIMEDDRETLHLLADRVIPALRTAPPGAGRHTWRFHIGANFDLLRLRYLAPP